MSRLQELIDEFCPNGVEYKRIDQVATIKNGSDHKHLDDGDIPVYGSGGIMRYCNTASYSKPSVLLPRKGSVGNVFYVDEPFWNVDTVFYTEIDTAQIDVRFFYYLMVNANLAQYSTSAARPSLTQKVLNKVRIPVPPIEVQREIVRILNEYTAARDELVRRLEEEITLREQQQLLTQQNLMLFEDEVASIPIGEVADVSSGATPSRKNKSNFAGTIPWVKTGEVASGDILKPRSTYLKKPWPQPHADYISQALCSLPCTDRVIRAARRQCSGCLPRPIRHVPPWYFVRAWIPSLL